MARQEEVSVQFYQEKLEADSQSLVFSRLADCYRKKGEIQQAIGVCMQGLGIHPEYVTGRVILGRCYLEQEKLKEAVAEFVRVVELDRRNQVAVKMIADVYARQGMKEKAGDLYAYLCRMDPENQSLARLAQSNLGNGETNIRRILGIAARVPGVQVQEQPELQVQPDTIFDVDKTIQMDFSSKGSGGKASDISELGEMLVKTQKFDTEELNAAADAAGSSYHVEETISDIGAKQGGQITGDDISSRMAMIFGEQEAKNAAEQTTGTPVEAMDVVPDTADETADNEQKVREDTVAEEVLDSSEPVVAPVVSGTDVTSRIEQLFGEETMPVSSEPGAEAVSDFTQAYVPGPAAEEPSTPEVGVSESPEPALDELKKEEKSDDISGKDVTDRLNEMFSDTSSITGPLAEIGRMLDQHMPAIDDLEPAASHGEMQDDLPTESIDIRTHTAAPENIDEQEVARGDSPESISGDDVALRLETIFEEGEQPEVPSEANAVTEDDQRTTRPEEDTKSPLEATDQAIIIGGDIPDSDIREPGEATLFASEPAEAPEVIDEQESAAEAPVSEPEMSIDDAVAQETQPEMSGDDVVGRLDELFSDDLLKDAGLESIPEGDKDDDAVNQGFYTMSGENAQTTVSDDTLLSELDKSDSEGPQKTDQTEIAPESEEKTILMEQDGGDLTLAVAEEETIISDRAGSPQGRPEIETPEQENLSAKIDDDDVTEATQIRIVSQERQAIPVSGLDSIEDAAYPIPDHVLTPTLADIYYQQGQPKLALQIYNRLLEADPDNEKIAERMQEIKRVCEAIDREETSVADIGIRKQAVLRPESNDVVAPSGKERKKAGRPLAGVRIKKVYKNRIKKKK